MKKCEKCGYISKNNEFIYCVNCGSKMKTITDDTNLSLDVEKKNGTDKKNISNKILIGAAAFVLIAGIAVAIEINIRHDVVDDVSMENIVSVSDSVQTTTDDTTAETTTTIETTTTATTTTTAETTTTVTTTAYAILAEKKMYDVDDLYYSYRYNCFYLHGVKYNYIYTTKMFVLYNYADSYDNPIIYAYSNDKSPTSVYSLEYPDCSANDPEALGYFCATRADTLLWDCRYASCFNITLSDCPYIHYDSNIIMSNIPYTLTDSNSGEKIEDCFLVKDERFSTEQVICDTLLSVLNYSLQDIYDLYFCTEPGEFSSGYISCTDGNMYLKKSFAAIPLPLFKNIFKIEDYSYTDSDTIHYKCLLGNDYDNEYDEINEFEFKLDYNYDTNSWVYSGDWLNLGNSY